MSNNYRPCEVKHKKAIFHEWVHQSKPVPADNLRGGAPAGQLTQVFALIEYEDGQVSFEYPNDVTFTDLLAVKINTMERKIDKWKS